MRKIRAFWRLPALCCVMSCLLACSQKHSGFEDFYQGESPAQTRMDPRFITCMEPELARMPENRTQEEIELLMFTEGYTLMGSASWQGALNENPEGALAQGRSIGACKVLWAIDYSHTESAVVQVPVYTPNPWPDLYGGLGWGSGWARRGFWGLGFSYAPPPYVLSGYAPATQTISLFNYKGLFFAQLRPSPLGVKTTEPDDAYKRKFDTRRGGLVLAVRKNGAAWKANIFPGDVIVSVNNQPFEADEYTGAFKRGAINKIKIYRDGKNLHKDVMID